METLETVKNPEIQADEGGVEVEKEGDDDAQTIETPFNPEKIRIETKHVVVGQLLTRIEHGEIDLAPDFQRAKNIWKKYRKSRLIESLLLRIPIPVFYVSADEEGNWAVVDGIQRISTIDDYVQNEFELKGLQYLTQFDEKYYSDLPRNMHRRISETELIVNVIDATTPAEVMFNIFSRINTGGEPLSGQEIRHALHPGPARDFLRRLAQSEEFQKATDSSLKPDRMQDRECVLRFLAFYKVPWSDYKKNDLDGFLVNATKAINLMNENERDEVERAFKKAMNAAVAIFGDDAFRKRSYTNEGRNPINKALFETWSVLLAQCSERQIDRLVENKTQLKNKFRLLIRRNTEFVSAISTARGTPQKVWARFEEIKNLVSEYL